MSKRTAGTARLTWEPSQYNPQALQSFSESQLRSEYTRLRDIARKRIQRLSADPDYWDSKTARYNTMERYKRLSEMRSESELRRALSDIAHFVNARTGTVRGLREADRERVKTLNENGYTFVTMDNLRDWGDFMQWLKAHYPHKPSETGDVLDMAYKEFKELRAEDITPEEVEKRFDEWLEDQYPESVYFKADSTPVPEEVRKSNPRKRKDKQKDKQKNKKKGRGKK